MVDRFMATGTVVIPPTAGPVTVQIPSMRTVHNFTLLSGDAKNGVYCTGTGTAARGGTNVVCQCATREADTPSRGVYDQLFHKNINGSILEIDGVTFGEQSVSFTPKAAIGHEAVLQWRAWGARQLEVSAPPPPPPQAPPVQTPTPPIQ